MDAVSAYLCSEGLQPQLQTFLDTEYELGYAIDTGQFRLTYRLDGERLLLCHFTATGGDGQAVLGLLALLHRVERAVPALRHIDALILPAPGRPGLDEQRQRLAQLMRAQGAHPVRIDGDTWLRYVCRR